MQFLVLGIGLAIGIYLLAQAFGRASPAFLARFARYVFFGLASLVLVWIALRASPWTLVGYVIALMPLLLRLKAVRDFIKLRRGPAKGQQSSVRTRLVQMTLDHDTGQMDGEVTEGPFAGRLLSALSDEDVMALWREAAGDGESVAVLEAYLDRRIPDWREEMGAAGGTGGGTGASSHGAAAASGGGVTSDAQARAVLGLEENCTPEEIRDAHKRLLKHLHPDQGGSTYLASIINSAKDRLLESWENRANPAR